MSKEKTIKYAELFISMSTEFLMGRITENHFKETISLAVKTLDKNE